LICVQYADLDDQHDRDLHDRPGKYLVGLDQVGGLPQQAAGSADVDFAAETTE
jgi:hypothetical protein